MTQVDHHAELVHARDDVASVAAQPRIGRLETAFAQDVAVVVRELDDADAESLEVVEIRRVALEHRRVLESVDEAESPGLLGAPDVRERIDLHQDIGMRLQLVLPVGHPMERVRERVALTVRFTAVMPDAFAFATISGVRGLAVASGVLNGPGLARQSTAMARS